MSPETPGSGNRPGGTLVVVVGPSGAGKDSLINHARNHFAGDPSVLFVRRAVTRAAAAAAEDHDCLDRADFAAALTAGLFAVSWTAHGLSYGIPATARSHVAKGGVAVLNGSRAALPAIEAAFPRILTVHVTARPEILAARLAGRGREGEQDILKRLERAGIDLPAGGNRIEIDNSGDLHTATEKLVTAIRDAAGGRP